MALPWEDADSAARVQASGWSVASVLLALPCWHLRLRGSTPPLSSLPRGSGWNGCTGMDALFSGGQDQLSSLTRSLSPTAPISSHLAITWSDSPSCFQDCEPHQKARNSQDRGGGTLFWPRDVLNCRWRAPGGISNRASRCQARV